MKNTLVDLNNHLFAELERLSDERGIGGRDQEGRCSLRGINADYSEWSAGTESGAV